MGIKGLYSEIGPGDRIALSKLAVEFFERTGRPLRVAIDISIWLFQIQASEGGTNPALRTFYYRILRLITLSIHPVFVFDGPNKPPFKRHKRTMVPGVKTVSIPEFLAKQLLKHFALPVHLAPGEAEAECALIQRLGYVDAVLSDDADTLMFGSGLTLRNYSPEGSLKSSVPTHVNVYEAEKVKKTAGIDREGMILVALMSGGDYIPEGMPGCGPKIACEAARAGFGKELCSLERNDEAALAAWKERLAYELRTNESKFFGRKHPSLNIPEDFPRLDILRFYTDPCVSTARVLSTQLQESLKWDTDIDFKALRTFAGDAFEWFHRSGAKKFIRNLAPALLIKHLRLRDSRLNTNPDVSVIAEQEDRLVKSIHLKRNHVSTDHTTEIRIGFIPLELVPLDLDSETPDPENTDDCDIGEEENAMVDFQEEPTSPRKKRGPSKYDPGNLEKIWVLETFVKHGIPLKFQDWEETFRRSEKAKETKKRGAKAHGRSNKLGHMPIGSLDKYAKIIKPGTKPLEGNGKSMHNEQNSISTTNESCSLPTLDSHTTSSHLLRQVTFPVTSSTLSSPPSTAQSAIIDLSSSPIQPQRPIPRRRSQSPSRRPILDKPEERGQTANETVDAIGPSSTEDASILVHNVPPTVTVRKHRSPIRRAHTTSGVCLEEVQTKERIAQSSTKTAFRMPTGFPVIEPRTGEIGPPNEKAIVSHAYIDSDPMLYQGGEITSVETVNLCSNPSTPKRRQKSILDWASPSNRTQKLAPTNTMSFSTIEATHTNSSSIFLDVASNRIARQTTAADSLGPARYMGARDLSIQDKIPIHYDTSILVEPQIRFPDQSNANLINPGAACSANEVARPLRVLKSNAVTGSENLDDEREDCMRKRSKKAQWRPSQVDLVDLTGL